MVSYCSKLPLQNFSLCIAIPSKRMSPVNSALLVPSVVLDTCSVLAEYRKRGHMWTKHWETCVMSR